jgi:hypothetical protein
VFFFQEASSQRYIEFEGDGSFSGHHWSVNGMTLQIEYIDFLQEFYVESSADSNVQNGFLVTSFLYDYSIKLYPNEIAESFLYVWEDTIADLLMGISPQFYPDSIGNKSVILYDYNQSIGDTVRSDMLNLSIKAPFAIFDVDTLEYHSINRRTLHCHSINDPNVEFEIIEGLGTNLGFLTNVGEWIEGGSKMECGFIDWNFSYGSFSCITSLDESIIGVQTSPNPFQDNLTIQLSEQIQGQITILDFQGKTCHQEKLRSSSQMINLGSLKSGIYLMNIRDNNGVSMANQKIIKQ